MNFIKRYINKYYYSVTFNHSLLLYFLKFHKSIYFHKVLEKLEDTSFFDIIECPNELNHNTLKSMDLSFCKKITKIPDRFCNLETLECINTKIIQIPHTFINLSYLNVAHCNNITCIPSSFINLIYLNISHCKKIDTLSKTYINLTDLNCSYCPIASLPDNFSNLKLLDCSGCDNITEISKNYINLTRIYCTDCPKITSIDIYSKLETLNCSYCHNLTNLIDSNNTNKLSIICCADCPNLMNIPTTFIALKTLYCASCPKITEISSNFINIRTLCIRDCRNILSIPYNLTNLTELDCSFCENLKCIDIDEFSNFYSNLTLLNCSYSRNIIKIPSISTSPINLLKIINNGLEWLDKKLDINVLIKFYYPSKFNITDCVWLNHPDNKDYESNIQKLKILQHWFKKTFKYRIFKRWIKSEDGVKWIYHPDNIGGKLSKYNIMQSIMSLQ